MTCINYNKFNSLIIKNIEGYFEVSELRFRVLDAQIIFYKNYKKVKTVDVIWDSEDTYKSMVTLSYKILNPIDLKI